MNQKPSALPSDDTEPQSEPQTSATPPAPEPQFPENEYVLSCNSEEWEGQTLRTLDASSGDSPGVVPPDK